MSILENRTLRVLLEEAGFALRIYRSPDTAELRARLRAVLNAAGMHYNGLDALVSIDEAAGEDGYFEIETSYSVRGCSMSDTYRLPTVIVDAPDPVVAATAWKRAKDLRDAKTEVMRCEAALAQAQAKLATLTGVPAPSSEPMEAFLVVDLARELRVEPLSLITLLQAMGLGNYSINTALSVKAARAVRAAVKESAQSAAAPVATDR